MSLQETGLPEAGLVGIELGVDQSVVPDLSLSRLWIDFAGAENGPLTGTEQLELQGIPHWSWTGASTLPQAVSVEDLGQIRELAGQVHAAFASADVEEIVGLMSTKLDDFAKISGDRAGEEQLLRDWMSEVLGPGGVSFVALHQDEIVVERVNSHVLRVLDVDGKDPIRTGEITVNDSPGSFRLPLYVSKLDGVWRIVR